MAELKGKVRTRYDMSIRDVKQRGSFSIRVSGVMGLAELLDIIQG